VAGRCCTSRKQAVSQYPLKENMGWSKARTVHAGIPCAVEPLITLTGMPPARTAIPSRWEAISSSEKRSKYRRVQPAQVLVNQERVLAPGGATQGVQKGRLPWSKHTRSPPNEQMRRAFMGAWGPRYS
jgi:hypothetical protein